MIISSKEISSQDNKTKEESKTKYTFTRETFMVYESLMGHLVGFPLSPVSIKLSLWINLSIYRLGSFCFGGFSHRCKEPVFLLGGKILGFRY